MFKSFCILYCKIRTSNFQITATGLEPTTTYFVNKHSTIWPKNWRVRDMIRTYSQIFKLVEILRLFLQKKTLILYKKSSFPLRISSVNVTKSVVSYGFGHIFMRKSLMENFIFCEELALHWSPYRLKHLWWIKKFQKLRRKKFLLAFLRKKWTKSWNWYTDFVTILFTNFLIIRSLTMLL